MMGEGWGRWLEGGLVGSPVPLPGPPDCDPHRAAALGTSQALVTFSVPGTVPGRGSAGKASLVGLSEE